MARRRSSSGIDISPLLILGALGGIGYLLYRKLCDSGSGLLFCGTPADQTSPIVTTGPSLPPGCDPVLGCPKDVTTGPASTVTSSPGTAIGQNSPPPMQGAPPGYTPGAVQNADGTISILNLAGLAGNIIPAGLIHGRSL